MNHRRLLILDDDPEIGQTIQFIAESARLESVATETPEEFFRLLGEWQPTHIALDLVMPRMDGVEVIAELARRGCRAQIIITSGVGSRILDAAGRSAAAHGLNISGVLSKPFSPSALRALLSHDDSVRAQPANQPMASPHYQVTVAELE
jgi:CheY-like chemotaxis protein